MPGQLDSGHHFRGLAGRRPTGLAGKHEKAGRVALAEKQPPQCRNNARIGSRVGTVGNDGDSRGSYPTGLR